MSVISHLFLAKPRLSSLNGLSATISALNANGEIERLHNLRLQTSQAHRFTDGTFIRIPRAFPKRDCFASPSGVLQQLTPDKVKCIFRNRAAHTGLRSAHTREPLSISAPAANAEFFHLPSRVPFVQPRIAIKDDVTGASAENLLRYTIPDRANDSYTKSTLSMSTSQPVSRVRKALAVQRYELETSHVEQFIFLEVAHDNDLAELKDEHEVVVKDLQRRLDLANTVLAKRQLRSRTREAAVNAELADAHAEIQGQIRSQAREAALSIELGHAHTEIVDVRQALLAKEMELSRVDTQLREQLSRNVSMVEMLQKTQEQKDAAVASVNDLINQIRVLHKEVSSFHTAYQTVNEKLGEVEKQKQELATHVEALVVNRTKQYLERDQFVEDEFPCVLRPDQLHDAEQALMMSQQNHKKECELTSFLCKRLKVTEKEHARYKLDSQLTVDKCQEELALVKEAVAMTSKANDLHLSLFEKMKYQKVGAEMDEELARSLQASLEQDEAMSQELQKNATEIADLRLLYRGTSIRYEEELTTLRAELRDTKLELDSMIVEKEGAEWSLGCKKDELKEAEERASAASRASQIWEDHLKALASATCDDVQQAHHDHLNKRIKNLEDRVKFYQRHTNDQLLTIHGLQSDIDLRDPFFYNELSVAHMWLNQRNEYLARVKALEERFANELLIKPLELPADAGRPSAEDAKLVKQINQKIMDVFKIDLTVPAGNPPCNAIVEEYNAMLAAVNEEKRKRLEAERNVIPDDSCTDTWVYDGMPVISPDPRSDPLPVTPASISDDAGSIYDEDGFLIPSPLRSPLAKQQGTVNPMQDLAPLEEWAEADRESKLESEENDWQTISSSSTKSKIYQAHLDYRACATEVDNQTTDENDWETTTSLSSSSASDERQSLGDSQSSGGVAISESEIIEAAIEALSEYESSQSEDHEAERPCRRAAWRRYLDNQATEADRELLGLVR